MGSKPTGHVSGFSLRKAEEDNVTLIKKMSEFFFSGASTNAVLSTPIESLGSICPVRDFTKRIHNTC